MQELFELVMESAPAALGFFAVALVIALVLRAVLKKRFSILWTVIGCAYLGFLLAGTLRPESVQELFVWEKPWQWGIDFQLDLSEGVSSLHGLFNIALFVPWGVIGMIMGKKLIVALPCVLTCALMTVFIEKYQLFHRRSFDAGDIVTNLLGCVAGIVMMLPAVIYWQTKKSAAE